MIKSFLLATTLSLVLPLFSFAAIANGENQTTLVFDASGSMWGKIEGKHKIEIAREVVSNAVNAWDQNQALGLVAYGHNRAGDCSDIELLIKPGAVNAQQFSLIAGGLNPKGKTPLSAAVKMAAHGLNYTESKATVILISDGKETCGLDPCTMGRSLEQSGVDFTAHIIGFDVSEEDSIGLRCLAQETGGAYIDAENADQLNRALEQTRAVVTDTQESKRTLASVSVPNAVFAGASFAAKWSGPKNVSDYLIVKTEDGTQEYSVAYIGSDDSKSPAAMVAPESAGTYLVHYSLKDKASLASDKLIVTTPEATVDAPDSVEAGKPFSVLWSGPKNEFDSLRIFDADGKSQRIYSMLKGDEFVSPSTLRAPVDVGEYDVEYRTSGKKTLAKDRFVVTPAQATVSVPREVNIGAPFEVNWTGPRNKHDRLRLLDSSGERLNNYKFVDKKGVTNSVVMTAPGDPGEYFIAYDALSSKIIAKAPLMVLPIVAMVGGPKVVAPDAEYQVHWHGPNYKGDSIYTYSAAGNDMRKYRFLGKKNSMSPITLQAPKEPGNYELRYQIKGRTVIATHAFTVR
jgi:Ca-activated chloride channel family protein